MPRHGSTLAPPAKRPAKPVRIASITEFAKYLGLSVCTVSRAMNAHPAVKESTRRLVLAAMEEVGYQPNPIGRALVGARTGLIGVCSIGLSNPILNTKIYHLQQFLRGQGLRVVLELGYKDPENEIRILEDFRRIRVDGIVLMYSSLSSDDVATVLQGMPCVQVDPHEAQAMPTISIDRRKAMRLLFEHLLRLEHRSFALLCEKGDPWRGPSLVEAAQAHGLDPAKVFRFAEFPEMEDVIEAGQIMAEEVLSWRERPTAIIARDDQMVLGALQALRSAGVEVPREMSVTGFDNLSFARKLHPTLTTIDQHPEQLMQRAGELLLEQVALSPQKRGRTMIETISPSLVIGESTGPAPRG